MQYIDSFKSILPNNNIIILLIILLNLSSHSQTHIINKGNNEFKTIENNYNKFSFTNILNNIETVYDSSKNGIYLKLKIADYGNNLKIGEPELPVLRYLIEVPYNSQITVKIIKKTFKTIDLNQTDKQIFIKPAQASLSKNKNRDDIDFKINTKLYKTDSFYKASDSLVTIDLLGNMRGINIARLNIFPIEYNPVLNKLIVYDTLITEIIFKNADLKKTLSSKQIYFNSFYQSNSGFIKNYKTLNYKSQNTTAPLKYVIVSDPLFKESLTPFIKWKTQQGFNVIEVYTDQTGINRDSALIRQYLKELYLTATENNPPPSFILFAGDIQHIPAYKGKAKKQIYYTDLYYCEYTGDFLPDVLSGRFSASNVSEMQTIVQKTIEYEKFLFDDPTYLINSVMIAGYDKNYSKLYCNGQISYAEQYYYNQQNGYLLDKYLYPESSSKQEEILEKLNRGVGFINYTGHGSWDGWVNPAFFTYDIPLMQNKGKYPFIIGNACYTQSYERSSCLGEALLRAADKGAIGYIGGTSETFWDEDYWWSVGFGAISPSSTYESNDLGVYDRLFHTHNEPFEDWAFTMSDIIFAGNLSVMQSGSEYTNLYWESYQLMGDPSLMPYLANPAKINMEYEDTILITASSLTIKTDPYIYIGLTQNDSLIGAALSNSGGLAEIVFIKTPKSGLAQLVATGPNKQSFISNIHFVDNQNVSFKINNIKLNDITGNNNNLADFGEKISTFVNIKNEGNIKAGKLKTLIFSENQFIKVLEKKSYIDSIPAGDTASVKIPFYIEIDSLVDNNYAALMRLEITGNDSITKYLHFSIILHSPAFKILSFNITDTNSIISNERLEPDKYFFIKIKVANLSITDAKDTKIILVTDNKDVKIDNNNYNVGLLTAGQEATALFKIYINKSVVSGSVIEFKFKIISGSYYSQQTFIKFAGNANENFESSDFLKFNWDTVATYPWLITNNSVFEGNYSARSGLIQSKNYSPLSISFNVSENDSISFYLKTFSSSSDNYLSFYIDDDLIITVKGQNNWQRYSYPVYTGYRTFKWQYTIINSADPLTDYACLDYISFPVSIDVLSTKFAASSNKFHFQFTNFPNPADIYTDIRFDLQKPSRLNIEITDIFGRLCYSSNYLHFNKGANVFRINTADFNEGLYLIRFTFDNKINYSRLIILH